MLKYMQPPSSWLITQVVAYEKVEEDHWPERIYVERTRSAIERAAHQFHLPDDASTLSGCIDLLQVGSPWVGPSQWDIIGQTTCSTISTYSVLGSLYGLGDAKLKTKLAELVVCSESACDQLVLWKRFVLVKLQSQLALPTACTAMARLQKSSLCKDWKGADASPSLVMSELAMSRRLPSVPQQGF